jgi:hypothetical protein
MKYLIIVFMLLTTLKASSQECVKFVQPKWSVEIYTTTKNYNPNDYEWKLVDSAKAPVFKAIYKQEIVKDAYTGIDSIEFKKSGKICTKTFPAEYATIVDRYDIISPAVPPVYAWLLKAGVSNNNVFKKLRNLKDGYLTITNCE